MRSRHHAFNVCPSGGYALHTCTMPVPTLVSTKTCLGCKSVRWLCFTHMHNVNAHVCFHENVSWTQSVLLSSKVHKGAQFCAYPMKRPSHYYSGHREDVLCNGCGGNAPILIIASMIPSHVDIRVRVGDDLVHRIVELHFSGFIPELPSAELPFFLNIPLPRPQTQYWTQCSTSHFFCHADERCLMRIINQSSPTQELVKLPISDVVKPDRRLTRTKETGAMNSTALWSSPASGLLSKAW